MKRSGSFRRRKSSTGVRKKERGEGRGQGGLIEGAATNAERLMKKRKSFVAEQGEKVASTIRGGGGGGENGGELCKEKKSKREGGL